MLNEPHIARAFDRDLEAVQAMIMRMGGLVEAALSDAATALETQDNVLAEKVRLGDAAIDALEDQVNSECARVIALRSPTATDLRTVLTVMKIASGLERCGDYAKNLAKRAIVLNTMTPIEGAAFSIKRMSRLVGLLLKDALDAFIARDAALAEDVRQRDKEVDQLYNSIFRVFLTHMMEDPRNISACMHLHFIAKNIERVGDHATGIAEQVIYLATGALPDEARPKSDVLSEGQI
ncbi:MAG: phosphate transport system regulatory protein PhoU [Rhodobacterales bacterium RIFCSPHIGHO2_02_FULL_62_130]|jgi:phosphate transport system protein|nr:MAG: phosphate transport system regulatory protein PhoU [Rhodobacterales bacterium RIFCSPHIGHO2_02_FULL_62_130]OHC56561.1 MAG: phosphate transport system regulatory protein PhoU [Rhodobacterales bacterium RIFCSPHIGHO2_12_FULL_62_75]